MIDRTRVSVQVAKTVQETISSMGLKAGDRLPSQSELARRMNVSVPTLREGLERLAMIGAVKMIHGVGTIVTTPSGDDLSRVLEPLFFGRDDSYDELAELLRALVLPIAESSGWATVEAVDANNQLEQWSRVIETADNPDQFVHGLTRFFKTLSYRHANNTITGLANSVHELILFRARDRGVLTKRASKIKRVTTILSLHLGSDNPEGLKQHISKYISLLVDDQQTKQERFRLGTGSAGGSFDRLGSRLAAFLPETKELSLRCVPTGGGIENADLTNIGRVDFSITQLDVARQAWEGSGLFSGPHSHLRAVCRLAPLYLWAIVHDESPIHSITDLTGTRIATGAVGGNTSTVTRTILDEIGLPGGYESFQLSLLNALNAFRKHELDAVFYLSQVPFVALDEIDLVTKVRLLPVEVECTDAWTPGVIRWQPSRNPEVIEVQTIAVPTVLITHRRVENETVLKMLSGVIDFLQSQEQFSDISELFKDIPVPFHDAIGSDPNENQIFGGEA